VKLQVHMQKKERQDEVKLLISKLINIKELVKTKN